VHLDVKKVGRIPAGGGWRIHGRDSDQAKAADRARSAGAKRGYVYQYSAVRRAQSRNTPGRGPDTPAATEHDQAQRGSELSPTEHRELSNVH
jgi:hypothetical protein